MFDGSSSLERRGCLTERAWTPEGRDDRVGRGAREVAPTCGFGANYRASGVGVWHMARL